MCKKGDMQTPLKETNKKITWRVSLAAEASKFLKVCSTVLLLGIYPMGKLRNRYMCNIIHGIINNKNCQQFKCLSTSNSLTSASCKNICICVCLCVQACTHIELFRFLNPFLRHTPICALCFSTWTFMKRMGDCFDEGQGCNENEDLLLVSHISFWLNV
jgi:hypothetical protein